MEWERCRRWVEAALEYADGCFTIEDIRNRVASGQYQFWPGANSAVITEVIQYPRKRALHIFLAGGQMDELASMYPDVEAYARFRECTSVTLSGRRGWLRSFMAKYNGFTEQWVSLGKAL